MKQRSRYELTKTTLLLESKINDLLPGGHRVARLPTLRLPLAEEVDGHFRSALQFHFSAVQRPSLVLERHGFPVYREGEGGKKGFASIGSGGPLRENGSRG